MIASAMKSSTPTISLHFYCCCHNASSMEEPNRDETGSRMHFTEGHAYITCVLFQLVRPEYGIHVPLGESFGIHINPASMTTLCSAVRVLVRLPQRESERKRRKVVNTSMIAWLMRNGYKWG